MTVPTDELQDHGVYYLQENPLMEFGVYDKERFCFIGLDKTSDEVLVEAEVKDHKAGIWGEVIPMTFLDTKLPDYIQLTPTMLRTVVWEDNWELKEALINLREEHHEDWIRKVLA